MRAVNRPSPWLFAPQPIAVPTRAARRNTSIGGLSFAVEIDGENVPMRISETALRRVFGAGPSASTWLATYRLNARRIDALAIAQYRRDPLRPVCLTAEDFACEALA